MFAVMYHVINRSLLIVCFAFSLATGAKVQDQSDRWEPLLRAVEAILAGKNLDTSDHNSNCDEFEGEYLG